MNTRMSSISQRPLGNLVLGAICAAGIVAGTTGALSSHAQANAGSVSWANASHSPILAVNPQPLPPHGGQLAINPQPLPPRGDDE
jgi:hypothetical protein